MIEDHAQTLSEREGRRLPRGAPHEAVPDHLQRPLREWLDTNLERHLERRIALRLEVASEPRNPRTGRSGLAWRSGLDVLDAVDLVLQLDEALQQDLAELDQQTDDIRQEEDAEAVFDDIPEMAEELDELLSDGNSTYRVARASRPLRLVNIVDATVATAAASAIEQAEPIASELLAAAWVAAHAVQPDPDGAYRDAVRAVEVVMDPLVSPLNRRKTLGSVIRDLRDGGRNYELVLLDNEGDGSVEPLVELLQRLWQGQKSRHGGGDSSRPQTVEEARAAVQIAVLVVQWLADGALRARTPADESRPP